MSLALVVDDAIRPRRASFVRYDGPEAVCERCGPEGSKKRALFVDRARRRKLCAKCMVTLMDMRKADP